MTDEDILLKIVKLIPDYLMEGVKVGVAINKSDYNSITIPVSYTHLDVYKRQRRTIPSRGASGKA